MICLSAGSVHLLSSELVRLLRATVHINHRHTVRIKNKQPPHNKWFLDFSVGNVNIFNQKTKFLSIFSQILRSYPK